VIGAHFRSVYELYPHAIAAERRGLSDEKLATIVAGQRPVDLTRPEAVAYDFASALVSGAVLPELTYRAARHSRILASALDREAYRYELQMAELAGPRGFDSARVPEHYFTDYIEPTAFPAIAPSTQLVTISP
jgi:hypothetical protein